MMNKYAIDIYADHMSKCRLIQNVIPSIMLDSAFEYLKSLQWYSNLRHDTLWFVKHPCNCQYSYSKYNIPSSPMPPILISLMEAVGQITGSVGLNSCNTNLYAEAHNALGWHKDDESLFQAHRQNADIISVSLGAERIFCIRNTFNGTEYPIPLGHGDICTMEGLFQMFFEHCLLPHDSPSNLRINLTFRKIVLHNTGCPLAQV